ncbi:MAG: hypothetical protein FJW34_07915 [Acidobacteria bacterium]|nr:hypothetical protein [Acidobacteriota bacterium]
MRTESRTAPQATGSAVRFRPEFLDFQRGIRVGNLEENERITRILKLALESRFGQPFVTERWGRGVHWQWISWLPRANRAAKPLSSHYSFGCAKFFISLHREEEMFKCGLQLERGYLKAPRGHKDWALRPDWDWIRLLAALKPSGPIEQHLKRLLREGFWLYAGTWDEESQCFSRRDFPGVTKLRRILEGATANRWAGFQLFYGMRESEVRTATGVDLVESMLAVFREVTPVMNLTMQIRLEEER